MEGFLVPTFLDDGEELIGAAVLEAGAGPEVLGEADHARDVQRNPQRDVVHVQLGTRWHARHVGDYLVQDGNDIREAFPAAVGDTEGKASLVSAEVPHLILLKPSNSVSEHRDQHAAEC